MEKENYQPEEWGKFYSFVDPFQRDGGDLIRVPYVTKYPTLDPWIAVDKPNPDELILERNPYFFKIDRDGNQLPYIDGLHRSLVSNLEVQNMKIISGETDIQFQRTKLSDIPLFKKNREAGGYEVIALKSWQDQMLVYLFNLSPDDPILRRIVQDKRFRQALSLALNREEIKDSIFLGFGRSAQVAPAPGSPFWNEEVDYEQSFAAYDIDQANRLLDEMGLKWDKNHEYRMRSDDERLILPFLFYEVAPSAAVGAEMASEFWRAIGVDAPVKMVNIGLWWQRQRANEPFVTDWVLGGRAIINQYGFGYSGFFLTNEWWRWYNTDGEEGEEPTPEAKELYRLRDIILSTPSEEERIQAGREVFRSKAENIWLIGTVVETPIPFIYSKKLGNVSSTERYGYYTITAGEAAEQWFYKE